MFTQSMPRLGFACKFLDPDQTQKKKLLEKIQRKFHGGQDWLYEANRKQQAMFWPGNWIMLWKREIRKSKEFALGGRRGNRKFKNIEDVKSRSECCITVSHETLIQTTVKILG